MSALVSLALATLLFVGTHLAMSHTYRVRLVQQMGESVFRGVYSLIAFVTLAWMILAWRSITDSVPFWIAPQWAWWVGSAVMLLACVLLVGSFVRNPSLPHPGAKTKPIRPATGVFAITRHPMNWSFILWALVHLSLWWSPRNLIVATGILVLALAGSIGQDRRKLEAMGAGWRDWQARTSFVPFGLCSPAKSRCVPPRRAGSPLAEASCCGSPSLGSTRRWSPRSRRSGARHDRYRLKQPVLPLSEGGRG